MFEMPLERKAPGVIYRQPVEEPLQTGIKALGDMSHKAIDGVGHLQALGNEAEGLLDLVHAVL